MILACNFEELRALTTGAHLLLSESDSGANAAVAAPSEVLAQVEQLTPRLEGDLSIETLAEQRSIRTAVRAICDNLRRRMEDAVIAHSPGHEEAINYFFDFGHTRTVLHRLDQMGEQMHAIVEVMTGEPVTPEAAESVTFPD